MVSQNSTFLGVHDVSRSILDHSDLQSQRWFDLHFIKGLAQKYKGKSS